MGSEATIIIPMPPSVNDLYTGYGKGRRKNAKYVAWLTEAGWRINEARAAGRLTGIKKKSWYWTDIRLPQNHLGDSDNRLKTVHDLLHKNGITPDDKWLLGGTYMRCKDVEAGTCVVVATSVDTDDLSRWGQIKLIADQMVKAEAKA